MKKKGLLPRHVGGWGDGDVLAGFGFDGEVLELEGGVGHGEAGVAF